MREPETMGFFAVDGEFGVHCVEGRQPKNAVQISSDEYSALCSAKRKERVRSIHQSGHLTIDDIRAEAMALLNDIFELKGENMKAEDFKQLDEAKKKEALAAELAALKTKMPPAVDLGPINATLEELKAATGVLAGDVQNTAARVGAIEEAILSAGGK